MGRRAKPECSVEVAGRTFTLRTADRERLLLAAKWINKRINQLTVEHPLMKPADLYLLALLEVSYERAEFLADGKALLKHTDQLLECINNQLR